MPEISDAQIEETIQTKGLTAPRITAQEIDNKIKTVQYVRIPDTTVTVCCITLKNGFTTIGHSACISPENFDADLGKNIAYTKARDKIWELEAYLKTEALFDQQYSL